MSRFLESVRRAQQGQGRVRSGPPGEPRGTPWRDPGPRRFRVVSAANNKGGVGKTTLATNLAVYVRALREDLPILFLGLDDQPVPDDLFALSGPAPDVDLLGALRAGDLSPAIRLGQYGVHYVPASPRISELEAERLDRFGLEAALRRSGWRGLVIVDTKSDFGFLTRSALAASDLVLAVVKDAASLREARRIYDQLEQWNRPRQCARVALSLVDLRVKFGDTDVLGLLLSEIRRRGYPVLQNFVSRSPKIEGLHTNPEGRVHSILHGAPGSVAHRQMRGLAGEVLQALSELAAEPSDGPAPPEIPTAGISGIAGMAGATATA